jgi:hypothetical protein
VSGIRSMSTSRQLASLIGVAAILAAGIFFLSIRSSDAAESCQGLDKALQNNLNFIAAQKANPDAQSAARIANRQAVVNLIQQRRKAAGCTGNGGADANAGNNNAGNNNAGKGNAGKGNAGKGNAGKGNAGKGNAGNNAGNAGDANGGNDNAGDNGNTGNVVCPGSTVTLSGEAGDAAASSDQFPVGTKLKVTNLDNNQSITVPVTSTSGSCVLLNNKAFNEIHEEGKLLIRRARIEKVG